MQTVARWLLASAFLALFSASTPAPVSAAVPFEETGLKSFDDWSPDKTGTIPVTAKLQEAVVWCQNNQRTLYIPPGTYLVDGTIELRAQSSNSNSGRFPYIHGDAYNRPVIKLADGTFAGSTSPENAIPVFRLRHEDFPTRNSAWIFFSIFANVDFYLGDNPGACALNYAAAQDSHLYNVSITGTNFAAGIVGQPGRNAGNINLEVIGGRYGIVMHDAVGINLTGVRLIGQSEAALKINNWDGSTVVGLESSGPGPAIVIPSGGNSRQGRVYILDARIEITDPTKPAIQLNDRPLVLRDVYIKGTDQLVAGSVHSLSAPVGNAWAHVATFASAPADVNGKPAMNHLDGVKYTGHRVDEVSVVAEAPLDLRTRHLPGEIFAFNHPEAVNALTFPGATAAAKIQAALDGPDRVIYVPRGTHLLDTPLVVPAGKVLLGDPGKTTFLTPTYTPTSHTFVVSTENAEGWVALQDLYIATRNLAFDGAVHWQTSDGVMQNLRGFRASTNTEVDARTFQFSSQAGGKFYGLANHRNIAATATQPASANYRKVLVLGTSNPITFYGLNLERGGEKFNIPQPAPFGELIDCRNVRILGAKTEPDMGPAFTFINCQNVSLVGLSSPRVTGFPFARLLDGSGESRDIEFAQIGNATNTLTNSLIDPYADIQEKDLVVLFRKGTFDHGAFDSGSGPQEPKIILTSPANGSTFPAFGTTLTAQASVPGGLVAIVEFYANDTFVGADTTPPYASVWEPTATGTYLLTAEATDDASVTRTSDPVTVTVTNSVPAIATSTLPRAALGRIYSAQLSAGGGDGPLSWWLAGGSLPEGITLSPAGVLSGTPSALGTSQFTVRVRDSDLFTAAWDEDARALSLTVDPDRSQPGTYGFQPSHDAYLHLISPPGNRPAGNLPPPMSEGIAFNEDTLVVGKTGAVIRRSYLRFDLSGLGGIVDGAVLVLQNTDTEDRTGTYRIYAGTPTSWSETDLSAHNAPEPVGAPLASQTAIPGGSTVRFDVSSAVTDNGVYHFILDVEPDGNHHARFSSKEGSAAPVLEVTTIAAPVVTELAPIADSGVYQDQPALNGGALSFMQVNGAANFNKEGFLKFTVSGITGNVVSAKLRLTVVAQPGGTPSSNALVWSNDTTTWTESGINWSNKPASSILRDTQPHPKAIGGVIEFDVTAAVTGDGTYSFQIKGSGPPRVDYATRENANAAYRPKLVLTVQ